MNIAYVTYVTLLNAALYRYTYLSHIAYTNTLAYNGFAVHDERRLVDRSTPAASVPDP